MKYTVLRTSSTSVPWKMWKLSALIEMTCSRNLSAIFFLSVKYSVLTTDWPVVKRGLFPVRPPNGFFFLEGGGGGHSHKS